MLVYVAVCALLIGSIDCKTRPTLGQDYQHLLEVNAENEQVRSERSISGTFEETCPVGFESKTEEGKSICVPVRAKDILPTEHCPPNYVIKSKAGRQFCALVSTNTNIDENVDKNEDVTLKRVTRHSIINKHSCPYGFTRIRSFCVPDDYSDYEDGDDDLNKNNLRKRLTRSRKARGVIYGNCPPGTYLVGSSCFDVDHDNYKDNFDDFDSPSTSAEVKPDGLQREKRSGIQIATCPPGYIKRGAFCVPENDY